MEKGNIELIEKIIEQGKKLRFDIIVAKMNPLNALSQFCNIIDFKEENLSEENIYEETISSELNDEIEYEEVEEYNKIENHPLINDDSIDKILHNLIHVKKIIIHVKELYFMKDFNLLHESKDQNLSVFYIEYYFPISESGEMLSISEHVMISSVNIQNNKVKFERKDLFPVTFNDDNINQWRKSFIDFLIFHKSPNNSKPKLIGKVNFSFDDLFKLNSEESNEFLLKVFDINNQDSFLLILKIAFNLLKENNIISKPHISNKEIISEKLNKNPENILKPVDIYSYIIIKNAYIKNFKVKPSTFVRFRTLWSNKIFQSKLFKKTNNPKYNFVQFLPILLTENLAYKLKQNYFIIEIWNKSKSRTKLIGYAKIPLNLFYKSFKHHDYYLNEPTIFENNKLEIIEDNLKSSRGYLSIIIAMGNLPNLIRLHQSHLQSFNIISFKTGHNVTETGTNTDKENENVEQEFLSDTNIISENLDELIKMKIVIDCAYHLPFVFDNGIEIVPNCYVSCQLDEAEALIRTHTVNKSHNPVWNYEKIIDINKIDVSHKNLVFKVWHDKNEFPITKFNETAEFLGVFMINIHSILNCKSYLNAGIYNLSDYDGLCKGQIKIGIMPFNASHNNLDYIDFPSEKINQVIYNYENERIKYHFENTNDWYKSKYSTETSISRNTMFKSLRKKIDDLNFLISKLSAKSSHENDCTCYYKNDSFITMECLKNQSFDNLVSLMKEENNLAILDEVKAYIKTLEYAKTMLSKLGYTYLDVEDDLFGNLPSNYISEDKKDNQISEQMENLALSFADHLDQCNNDFVIPVVLNEDYSEIAQNIKDKDKEEISIFYEENTFLHTNNFNNAFELETIDHSQVTNANAIEFSDSKNSDCDVNKIYDNNSQLLENDIESINIESFNDKNSKYLESNFNNHKPTDHDNIQIYYENIMTNLVTKDKDLSDQDYFAEDDNTKEEDDADCGFIPGSNIDALHKNTSIHSLSNASTSCKTNIYNYEVLSPITKNSVISQIAMSSKSISIKDAQRIARIFALKFK